MQHVNRHGKTKEVRIGKWRRDRIGILAGSTQRWREEDPDFIDFELLHVNAAPPMHGVPCVNVEREYQKQGGWGVYTYSYEGVNSTFEFDDALTTYELDISMSEDPIETHVNFAALAKKYGWNDRKRQFAKLMPATGGAEWIEQR